MSTVGTWRPTFSPPPNKFPNSGKLNIGPKYGKSRAGDLRSGRSRWLGYNISTHQPALLYPIQDTVNIQLIYPSQPPFPTAHHLLFHKGLESSLPKTLHPSFPAQFQPRPPAISLLLHEAAALGSAITARASWTAT